MRRLKSFSPYFVFVLILIYPLYQTLNSSAHPLPAFAFLIPEASDKSISTHIWLQAAKEEGVPLEVLHFEEILNSFHASEIPSKVILLPDEVARFASPLLLSILQDYVQRGGKLVLVSDALTYEHNGRYMESFPLETYFKFPKIQGRVGDTIQFKNDSLLANPEWTTALQIPPGRYVKNESGLNELCTYQSDKTPYPHWGSFPAKDFDGKVLLQSQAGDVVAGIKKLGSGETLWVNMPLSYLAKRTDGLFLHSFLRWISEDWAGLPRLLSVPDGIGGVILNIHVDSNAALPGLETMKSLGMFSQGPFSIHVTAGPDARELGDGLGFNLPENKTSQNWVKYWVEHQHEVGAHGGWVHDFFGRTVNEKEDPQMVDFLEKNRYWVNQISGKPVLEYSSPVGNHPVWISRWLEKNDYHAYYFTGNNGLGPTRTFRDDAYVDRTLWSFPISAYRQIASFEEGSEAKLPQNIMQEWLMDLSQFVVSTQTARLFYFHPPGVSFYKEPLKAWMNQNDSWVGQRKFKWYTMNQLSNFLDHREHLKWEIRASEEAHHFKMKVHALNPTEASDFSRMVWRFSKKTMKNLTIADGDGTIREGQTYFEVQPSGVKDFELDYEELTP